MRIVTYNIHGCIGTDRRYDPERIASLLADLDADIIGLQEMDTRRPGVNGLSGLEYLAMRTGLEIVDGPLVHGTGGAYGNALLTRLPIREVVYHDLAVPGREPRGAIDAVLEGNDEAVRVLVTHLGLQLVERSRQLAKLAAQVAEHRLHGMPTMLLGDLNEWRPGGQWLQSLRSQFSASYTGRTWPSFLPILPLDRIYVDPLPLEARIEVCRTKHARVASDHLPVVADLRW